MAAPFVGVVAVRSARRHRHRRRPQRRRLFARIARAHDAIQGEVPGLAGLHDIDDYPEARTIPGLVVYRYDAPLCFANAEDFRTRVLAAVDGREDAGRMGGAQHGGERRDRPDGDRHARGAAEPSSASRGIVLALARVKQDLAVYLERGGLIQRIGSDHVFPTLPTAVEGFRRRHDSG